VKRPITSRLLLIALLQLTLASAQLAPVGQVLGPVPVTAVLDGDTVIVASNVGPRTVRLIGVDAPEPGQSGAMGAAFGAQATAYLRTILPAGTQVWLELDRGTEDAYGRLLAYVYVNSSNGQWLVAGTPVEQVNLLLVQAGLATVMTIAPNSAYAALYEAGLSEARRSGLGMWAPTTPGVALGQGASIIQLHCALFNPDTPNDENGEWVSVMLRARVDTTGFYLYDEGSASVFLLPAGVHEPGEIRVHNTGQGVWNNGGDVVYLKHGAVVIDVWDYGGQLARQGDVICR